MRFIHQFLEENARQRPDRVAIVCGDERRTFAEIDTAANRLARGLAAEGVRPGARVAVYLENSVETVIAIFGILKAGAAVSVINPATKADKLALTLHDAQPAALITVDDTPRRRVFDELGEPPVPVVIWVGRRQGQHAWFRVRSRSWDDLMADFDGSTPELSLTDRLLGTIIYTSGTTGEPKGVMSAHHDMAFAAAAIAGYLGNTADDVIFCALSLAFTYGLYQLITAMLVGATLVLEKNFVFPARALHVMAREQVTGFPAVPTMFALLLGTTDLTHYDLRSLRYITNAAAPLPPHQIAQIRATFPQARLYSMYGQTECKRTTYLPPEQLDRRPDSVGIPIPGTSVQVVDEHGYPVPPGTIGELVVRGPHLMQGYWQKPQATARRLRVSPIDGALVMHTGDLFRMDEDGYCYFVAREDDIIKSRGEKVSPLEIEKTLYGLRGVREVAALGVPDPILGEAIKVVVVLDEGVDLSERDIRAYCSRHLEDFMVPKLVEFRNELPKSVNGKLLRKDLKACVA